MTEIERVLSNLERKLDHEAVGHIRHKRSLHFFEPLKKKRSEGRAEGLEKAIEILQEIKQEEVARSD